jgi:hypothetical protein
MDVNILELNVMIMMNVQPTLVVLTLAAIMMKFLVMIIMPAQQIIAILNLVAVILPLIVKTTTSVQTNTVAPTLGVFMSR